MELNKIGRTAVDILAYFTGADLLVKEFKAENTIIAENTGDGSNLPLNVDLKVAVGIYVRRLGNMVTFPTTMIKRWTGNDLVAKTTRRDNDCQ
jgi:hypothetical protein